MPRVYLECDERYPDYCVEEKKPTWGSVKPIELTDAELRRVKRVTKQYQEIQDFLKEKYNDANM